jgi:predicted dienelactone hydrolase
VLAGTDRCRQLVCRHVGGGPSRLALALIAILALALVGPASAPAKTRQHPHAPYAIGAKTVTFVDTSRPTARNGTYPGAPSRTLSTLLLYPAKGDPAGPVVQNATPLREGRGHRFPLIVFSHGFTASGPAYQPVLEQFVRQGYVIAAPTFPLSNGNAPGGPALGDYVNQPADVSFVLTRTLRLARGHHFLAKSVDRRDIGVMGHSLGAITTLGVATNSCCLDRRIDAAAVWSGIELPFGTGTYFTKPTPPIMLVHGDADGTVPYAGGTGAYNQARPPKVLLTLLGGPHVFFRPPWIDPFVRTTTDFLDGYLKHRHGALRRLATDGTVPAATTIRLQLR